MRILLIADGSSFAIESFVKGLKKYKNTDDKLIIGFFEKNMNYQLSTEIRKMVDIYYSNKRSGIIGRIPKLRFVYYKLKQYYNYSKIKHHYDVCHIHAWTANLDYIIRIHKNKCKKLLVSITGSDFSDENSKINYDLIKYIDAFTIANSSYKEQFINKTNNNCKIYDNKYGLLLLDIIDSIKEHDDKTNIKKKWGIKKKEIVVTLGTNGIHFQQHIKALKSIKKSFNNKIPENIIFIIPLTYNRNEQHIKELKEYTNSAKINVQYLNEYMTIQQVAELRIITDIMIQVQTKDQFSGAMQEQMYAGGIVITGEWLSYPELKNNNAYYYTIKYLDELGEIFKLIINNIVKEKEHCNGNKKIISSLSGMKITTKKWLETYKMVLDE